MLQLYDAEISGHAHKVRLMLSLLGLQYERIAVDLRAGQQQTAEFLALNPFAQVPVLVDGELVLRDSHGILVYLARKYGDAQWLPLEPAALAQIATWLSTAANETANGPGRLRRHYLLGTPIDLEATLAITQRLLRGLEAHLQGRTWLVGEAPTLADVAMYSYVALAPQAKLELTPYPAICRWLGQIRELPGYVGMAGMLE